MIGREPKPSPIIKAIVEKERKAGFKHRLKAFTSGLIFCVLMLSWAGLGAYCASGGLGSGQTLMA